MSDKAVYTWLIIFVTMFFIGIGSLIYLQNDHTGTSLDSLQATQTATLEQLGKEYLVTAGNIGGHMYLFIRLKNEKEFVVKHAAMCKAAHPGGFDG